MGNILMADDQNEPTAFSDDVAISTRQAEVPLASFSNGQNLTASNSTGIGIASCVPNLEESLPNWTLLDQAELPRTPQIGSQLGGIGLNGGTPGVGLDQIFIAENRSLGAATNLGGATLNTLEEGWESGEPPPQSDWVMWTGFWRDTGFWIDTATWNDNGG
jgi:hypothetical protein